MEFVPTAEASAHYLRSCYLGDFFDGKQFLFQNSNAFCELTSRPMS